MPYTIERMQRRTDRQQPPTTTDTTTTEPRVAPWIATTAATPELPVTPAPMTFSEPAAVAAVAQPGALSRRAMLAGGAVVGALALTSIGAGKAHATGDPSTTPSGLLDHFFGTGQSQTARSAATSRTLRRGMKGNDVLWLQQQLNRQGFWNGTPDGTFGAQTWQAVVAFQKAHGLAKDGVAGPATLRTVAAAPKVSLRSSKGDGIHVDLGRQLLIVVRGGRPVEIHNTSTGSGRPYTYKGRRHIARTPRGDFRVYSRATWGWVEGDLGSMYKPHTFAKGGYAIHGSRYIPAFPDSHGCCRVSVVGMDHLIASKVLGGDIHIY